MPSSEPHIFERRLGDILVRNAAELTERWLRELDRRLPVDEGRIFPTENLLDHIPEVIEYIGEFIGAGGDERSAEQVRKVLRGLAELRHEQGYDVDEVIAEFDLLGGLLFEEMERHARELAAHTDPEEAVAASSRLYKALLGVTRVTADVFREAGIGERRARARLLGDFSASLAHELRNRLHAARAAVAVLEGGADLGHERLAMVAGRLRSSLVDLENLVDDVRTLSMNEASEEAVTGRSRPLAAICQDVVDQLRELAAAEGVELGIEGDLPGRAVDASRVELVMINLVTNGIRHRDPEATRPWVRVRAATDDDGSVRVEVVDNGPGVPTEDRRRIFERQQRGGAEVAGDGLGLAIVRSAVEQLGGAAGVEGEPGAGSRFWFTLPPVRERS